MFDLVRHSQQEVMAAAIKAASDQATDIKAT